MNKDRSLPLSFLKEINSKCALSGVIVLEHILYHGSTSLTDLARACRISTAAMTGIADSLEKTGWAQRTPKPDDRRVHLLSLTEAGSLALQKMGLLNPTES